MSSNHDSKPGIRILLLIGLASGLAGLFLISREPERLGQAKDKPQGPTDASHGTAAEPANAGTRPNAPQTPPPLLAKMDSHIVLALKKSRGEPPFDKPTSLDPDLAIEPDGRVLVDITASVTPALLSRIEGLGGKVINSFANANAIRALVPLASIEALAAREEVKFIAPAAQATTNREGAARGSSIKP